MVDTRVPLIKIGFDGRDKITHGVNPSQRFCAMSRKFHASLSTRCKRSKIRALSWMTKNPMRTKGIRGPRSKRAQIITESRPGGNPKSRKRARCMDGQARFLSEIAQAIRRKAKIIVGDFV